MSKTTNKFSPEVRERAVRLVLDNEGQHGSRWQGVKVMAADGYRKHPGTRGHRLLSNLIGLETKVRLWGN